MRTLAIAVALALLIPFASSVQADTEVTVDPAAINLGYMNVFNLPPPAGDGAYQFGSPWGLLDLVAFYNGNVLTLAPNTIGDPNPYWYTPSGGPGCQGNKIMEANAYAEVTGPLAGQTLTFSGMVLSNTLTNAHTVVAFIKDFAADWSSFNLTTVPLTAPGPFSVSLATVPDPARHVQWGFQMVGVDVWITDVAPYGTMVIGPYLPVPTDNTTWGQVKSLYR